MKNKIYKIYKKNKKALILRTFILSLFLLVVNTYAWFIYIDKFDGNITANVISWDVTFYDDGDDINSVALNIDNLYPGMNNFTKQIMIKNSGDLKAIFDYEIQSFNLFGEEYNLETNTSEELEEIIMNNFPFKIKFSSSKKELLSGGDNISFTVTVLWDFESNEQYFKLNKFFDYDNSITYYIYDGEYKIDSSVNPSNFLSKIDSLYIESDDADTYWGNKASKYKLEHPDDNCLSLKIDLTVTQRQN